MAEHQIIFCIAKARLTILHVWKACRVIILIRVGIWRSTAASNRSLLRLLIYYNAIILVNLWKFYIINVSFLVDRQSRLLLDDQNLLIIHELKSFWLCRQHLTLLFVFEISSPRSLAAFVDSQILVADIIKVLSSVLIQIWFLIVIVWIIWRPRFPRGCLSNLLLQIILINNVLLDMLKVNPKIDLALINLLALFFKTFEFKLSIHFLLYGLSEAERCKHVFTDLALFHSIWLVLFYCFDDLTHFFFLNSQVGYVLSQLIKI